MLKRKALLFLLLVLPTFILAQTNPAEKKFEKVQRLLQKNEIEKGEKQLIKLLDDYPSFGSGWDLLSRIRLYHYNESKNTPNLLGNMVITTEDEDGNEVAPENDTLGQQLMSLLTSIKPEEQAYNKYIYTMRKATLQSYNAYECAINLRNEMHSEQVDTLVNPKALKYYDKAEEEFMAKNYNKAATLYKRALEKQPDFYKAQLYLADSYYFLQNFVEAIENFKACAERYPTFLEPRKFLADAYAKEGLYENAVDASIEAMLVYPDPTVIAKMDDLLYVQNKEMTVEWQPRGTFPNTVKVNSDEPEFNRYHDPDTAGPTGEWVTYAAALEKVQEHCEPTGVIKEKSPITSARYLEVYSWQEMLKNHDSESLNTARKMQEEGYLDCYVLVTCFHDDLYEQYKHLVKNNPDKVRKYYQEIVIADR